MWDWANNIVKRKYAAAIRDLADKDNGWHFGAKPSANLIENLNICDNYAVFAFFDVLVSC
jgi:hypothetical protein